MNKDLIAKHNSKVKVEDTVIIVGDIAPFQPLSRVKEILGELNGTKILVMGNHDEFTPREYLEVGFTEVNHGMAIYFAGVGPVGIAHDPSNCLLDMKMPWINGHLHNLYKIFGNSVNVGVEVWDYFPVSDEELEPILKNVKKYGWEAMKNDPTGNIKNKGLSFY
jgi:calcineurin-like phosphoesterase family protein